MTVVGIHGPLVSIRRAGTGDARVPIPWQIEAKREYQKADWREKNWRWMWLNEVKFLARSCGSAS